MAQAAKTEPKERIVLPEGRLINGALFVRDIYKDPDNGSEGAPMYKAEVGLKRSDVRGEGTVEDKVIDEVEKFLKTTYGAKAGDYLDDYLDYLEGKKTTYRWDGPYLDGDKLAADRAKNGKEGDAYKGLVVIRTNTAFNKDGVKDAGGIAVYDQAAQPVIDASQVFNGCYGHVAVTIGCGYFKGTQTHWVKFYLTAFQVTRNDESLKLKAAASNPFAPVGGVANTNTGERRRRAG